MHSWQQFTFEDVAVVVVGVRIITGLIRCATKARQVVVLVGVVEHCRHRSLRARASAGLKYWSFAWTGKPTANPDPESDSKSDPELGPEQYDIFWL